MIDVKVYDFVRGPLLEFALYFFFAGIAYRFIRVLLLGLPKDYAKPKGNPLAKALEKIALKPTQGWRFFIEVFAHRGIQYVGGFLFHVGFLGLTFFVPQHSFLWKEIIGFELPYMPQLIADILAYSALLSLFALTVHRIFNPVLKLLTGKDEYFANFLIGTIIFTGLLASRWSLQVAAEDDGEAVHAALLGPDGEQVEERLGGMLPRAVAAVDHRRFRRVGRDLRRADLGVADDDEVHVLIHRADRVGEALPLGDRGASGRGEPDHRPT